MVCEALCWHWPLVVHHHDSEPGPIDCGYQAQLYGCVLREEGGREGEQEREREGDRGVERERERRWELVFTIQISSTILAKSVHRNNSISHPQLVGQGMCMLYNPS